MKIDKVVRYQKAPSPVEDLEEATIEGCLVS